MIYKKIKFLEGLTNTSSKDFQKALSVDYSYVKSFDEQGSLNAEKELVLLEVAVFFAKRIAEHGDKKILSEIFAIDEGLISDNNKLADAVMQWFLKKPTTNDIIKEFLYCLSLVPVSCERANEKLFVSGQYKGKGEGFYYGNEGKRRVALNFFDEAVKNERVREIIIYSDEETEWIGEYENFAVSCCCLLDKFSLKGGKIKIIHNVERNTGDIIGEIKKWIPFYAIGAVEPYYFMNKSDGVLKKTLFLACGYSAVFSVSMGDDTENSLNIYTKDENVVATIEKRRMNIFPSVNLYCAYTTKIICIYFYRRLKKSVKLIAR